MDNSNYHAEQAIHYTELLRQFRAELPKFLDAYFIGTEQRISPRTQLAYATDLKTFFEYIQLNNSVYRNMPMHDIDISILSKLTAQDIEEFLSDVKYYKDEKGYKHTNGERSIKRKLAAIRSVYGYFHKNRIINENPAVQIDTPKLHKKQIIRLDDSETSELLKATETGENLTKAQLKRHEYSKTRDVALITLLLGTGMRVSECVGIDLDDIDWPNDRIKIIRKGGNESFVYFGEKVRNALLEYMDIRDTEDSPDNALFLSYQHRRMSVRSVEKLVKKYASGVTTKHITPHKLRSTYGTKLYKATGDIYLVADALGHADVNTTRKHYADIEEERKASVKNINLL